MKRSTIYFWQPVLTDHAIFTYRALATHLDMDALCISDRAELGERREQGWTPAQAKLPMELLDAESWQTRIDALVGRSNEDIHVIASPFERSRINLALKLATRRKQQVYLSSEPYAPIAVSYFGAGITVKDRIKARLRPLVYRWHGLKYATRLSGVFAISPLAVSQFAAIGVPEQTIFPFGYFVPETQHELTPTIDRSPIGVLRVAFVGSLTARKGVLTARDAMRLMTQKASLEIYGPGNVAGLTPLPDNVRYAGVIAFGQTRSVVGRYDVLVVPSLHDGWAVVVNEAIQAGIAVVASNETGASAMIDKWQCGLRFHAGDAAGLAACLDSLASDPQRLARAKRQALALRPLLDPDFAGQYMAGCIRAAQSRSAAPACLWY